MAKRLKAMGVKGYQNGFSLTLLPYRLDEPLKRNKPTIYFVNSMSDLFHEGIPDDYIQKVFGVIRQSPQHTFQVLTKRAERLANFFKDKKPPENAWLGVTVEDRRFGLPRLEYLRQVPAQIRFASVEPLLEDLGTLNLRGIHWVIVGGESGPKARPMRQEWVLSIKGQCDRQRTSFFFKQWGGWGADGKKRAKKDNGRLLQGETWDSVPLVQSMKIENHAPLN
jgi:protein gp37